MLIKRSFVGHWWPVDGPHGGPAVATGAAMVAARVPLGAHVQLYHIHDFRQSQTIPDSRNRTPKETKLARLSGGGIGGARGARGLTLFYVQSRTVRVPRTTPGDYTYR